MLKPAGQFWLQSNGEKMLVAAMAAGCWRLSRPSIARVVTANVRSWTLSCVTVIALTVA